MVNTLNRVFGAITIFLCFGLAQVELQVLDTGDITYTSTSDISGIQFGHNGCADTAQDGTQGLLSITVSSSTVIGYDMSGAVLPSGSGGIVTGTSCSAADLSNFVFAGPVCNSSSPDYTNPSGNPDSGNCGAAEEGQAASLTVTAVDAVAPCLDEGLFVPAVIFPPAPAYNLECTDASLFAYYNCDSVLAGGIVVSDICPVSCNTCPSPAVPVTCSDTSADVCIGINSDGDIVLTSSEDIYGWQINQGSCSNDAYTGQASCEGAGNTWDSCNTSSSSAGEDWDGNGDTFATQINDGIFFTYSGSGHFVPAGTTTIIENTSCSVSDFSNVVISGIAGSNLSTAFGTIDDGACTDDDQDGICDNVDDCIGVLDACGICNGSGIPAGDCDCNGNTLDCANVCGGTSVVGGCDNVCGSTAQVDCSGVCGGLGAIDDCGVCHDQICYNMTTHQPSFGPICDASAGYAYTSPNSPHNPGWNAAQDCSGTCFGTAVEDCAGECGGSASEDCLGTCNGSALADNCGTCDSDPNNDCTADCHGDFGGSAAVDSCGVCAGGNTGLVADADKDLCGVCDGDNTSCADCAGTPNGSAVNTWCDSSCGTSGPVDDECGVCDGDGSTCDFGYNQSQQQAAYFIGSSSIGGASLDSGDLVIARFNGVVVGASDTDDLVIQGKDLDISVDGDVVSVCSNTGTCDYPVDGDQVLLSIWDDSAQVEYTPYSISNDGTVDAVAEAFAVSFTSMINSNLLDLDIISDCSGAMGGSAVTDGCSQCIQAGDTMGYLDECSVCQTDGDSSNDGACFQVEGLSVTGGMGEMFLSWTPNAYAASYNIYRDGELYDNTAVPGFYNDNQLDENGAGWMMAWSESHAYTVSAVSASGADYVMYSSNVAGAATLPFVTTGLSLNGACADPSNRPAACEAGGISSGYLNLIMVNMLPVTGYQGSVSLDSDHVSFVAAGDMSGVFTGANDFTFANGNFIAFNMDGATIPGLSPVLVNGELAGFSGGNFDTNFDGANDSWLLATFILSPSTSLTDLTVSASMGDFVFGGAYTHPELGASGVSFVTDLVSQNVCDPDFNPLNGCPVEATFNAPACLNADSDEFCDLVDDPCLSDAGNDPDGDGVCALDEVAGCQDNTACNYNSAATDGGVDCIYTAVACDSCSGEMDGTGTVVDNDLDDDGVCNADEVVGCQDSTACNYDPSATDAGSCNIPTACDTCSTDGTVNVDGALDGICESCDGGTIVDNDSDDDTVCDAADVCPGHDDLADSDNDGAPDACDSCPADAGDDSDGDGVCDSSDICPGGNDNLDADSDGTPDHCDVCPNDELDDADDDGVCGDVDICEGHPDQLDADLDGEPDGCDTCMYDPNNDADNDGVCGNLDICPGGDDNADADSDGTPDHCDVCPNDLNDDSDGDGVCDSSDVCDGGDDNADADSDGTPDHCDSSPNGSVNFGFQNATEGPMESTVRLMATPTMPLYGYSLTVNGAQVLDFVPSDAFGDVSVSGNFIMGFDAGGASVSGQTLLGVLYLAPNVDGSSVSLDGILAAGANGVQLVASSELWSQAECQDNDADAICDLYNDPCLDDAINDPDGDNVCDKDEVAGCQDNTACNYNSAATDGGVDCIYTAVACDSCSGEMDGTGTVVDNDLDDDGVCNADEVAGCQDSTACNYNSAATDGGVDCLFVDGICETCSGETDGTGTIVDNDADDDEVCNANDICAGGDDNIDTDIDGTPDHCDTCPNDYYNDEDNDNVCGDLDQCPGHDDSLDADGDTIADGCDLCDGGDDRLDSDGDTTPDACDADLVLHEGNNLVSFVALPSDLNLSSVFANSDLMGVIGEGSAAAEIGGSWYGSLSAIDAESGYWVQANSDQEIDVVGSISDDHSYTLHDANNLISYPYAQSQTIGDALPSNVQDEVFAIVGEGVASINLNGYWAGSLGSLEGSKGYWFARNAGSSDITFQYNAPSAGSSARLLSGDLPKVPEAYAYTQSTEQGFYFIESILVDGEPMTENNWIVAYNNDVVVGARMWTGEFTDIPAMGNDSSTETAGYMEMGSSPTFKMMNSLSGEMVDLYVDGTIDTWTNNGVSVVTLSTTPELPTAVTLNGSYPNPFNPATTISFSIPSEMSVDVKVYDISGRVVGELMNGIQSQGLYEITWDASSQASGLYFVRLVAGTEMHTQKIMLVK